MSADIGRPPCPAVRSLAGKAVTRRDSGRLGRPGKSRGSYFPPTPLGGLSLCRGDARGGHSGSPSGNQG